MWYSDMATGTLRWRLAGGAESVERAAADADPDADADAAADADADMCVVSSARFGGGPLGGLPPMGLPVLMEGIFAATGAGSSTA